MQQLLSYRTNLFWLIMYWITRVGLALTFIISGSRKLPGVKFTELPVTDPVGNYFQTMHDLGIYWNFIGYFQIVTGLLALINRTSPLAVLLMMPVTINIFLVSVALNMKGTPVITAAMVLANVFLLVWNFENYRQILNAPAITRRPKI